MKKWLKITIILALTGLVLSFGESTDNQSGVLTIQLKNIRSNNGNIFVFLYSYENQYPKKPLTYYRVDKKNVINGHLKVTVANVAFCDHYAVTLIDDENSNEDLDRVLGIPTEGFGFSNNVKPLFSLPKYNELLFNFKNSKTINIDLQYFL